VDLGQAFYCVLRQAEASSRENILVHGIGGAAQRAGADPTEALLAFLEFAGKAPLVGFHAAFDDTLVRRATREHLGEPWERQWIDLAQLAPELMPDEARARQNLDAWLERFGIDVFSRHDAAADALATAQLFLALLPRAAARRKTEAMLWVRDGGRWLGGRG
jgi:DNA polymerase-3 subunit epsilon